MCHFHTVGKDVADALTRNHLLDKLNNRLGVAPGKPEAARVLLGDEAIFKALDRIGDRRARANGVHAGVV